MALNTNVSKAIDRHLRTVTVQLYEGETIDASGEATDDTYTESSVQLGILPLSAKDLQTVGDGMYDRFDRKAYSVDIENVIPIESIVETDFGNFKVMNIDNRYYEGGFITYMLKRIVQ